MKIIKFLFLVFLIEGCDSAIDGNIKSLNNFYSIYIKENSKINPNFDKIDSLKHYYCTSELLYKIKDYDYDPFLNSQDCSLDYLRSMKFDKDSTTNDAYYVTYHLDNTIITINIKFINERNTLKINSLSSSP